MGQNAKCFALLVSHVLIAGGEVIAEESASVALGNLGESLRAVEYCNKLYYKSST